MKTINVQKQFTWDKIAGKIMRVYDEVIKRINYILLAFLARQVGTIKLNPYPSKYMMSVYKKKNRVYDNKEESVWLLRKDIGNKVI